MGVSNLRNVDWLATIKLAVSRGFSSALILVLIGAMAGGFSGPAGAGVGGALRLLLFWTFGATIGAIFYIWLLRAISATLGKAVGLVVTVCSLMQFFVIVLVAIGDPLVYVFNRYLPDLFGVSDFKLFNFVAVIFVQRHSAVDAERQEEI